GSGGLASQYPDVLQAYTEEEVAAIDMSSAPAVTNRFPYGFVTRRVDNGTTRDLPASPAPEQYDGAVTFAYRFSTQSSAANNPFTISILALAVEDDVTRITQSIEEQGGGQAAFEARAASLNASQARIFPGGAYNGPIPHIVICSVRTAGTRESPTAHIGSDGPALASLSPNPYAGSFIARDAELSATFSRAVSGGAPNTFAVHTFQAAGSFLNGAYRDDEPNTLTYTHVGPFFPGEEVEVSLTSGLACTPHVARYRVATGPASGRYVGEQFPVGGAPAAVLVRDLDGDGDLDVATGGAGGVTVLRADGTGRFAPAVQFSTGGVPVSLAAGDLNGDGRLDLVGANQTTHRVAVLINDGSGGYTTSLLTVATGPRSVTLGDVNGDGRLDIVTANNTSHTVSVLLALAGGGFGAPTAYPSGNRPTFVALSDISGDGNLDIVVANSGSNNIGVLRGNGSGGFAAMITYPVGEFPRSFALGDLNGDGRTDLAASNGHVLLGNAAGGFTAGTWNGISTPSVALADLNGDGKLDLVTSDVRVLLGTGTGTFAGGGGYAVGNVPQAVAVGDVTGDGRLDVVTANATVASTPVMNSNNVSVLVGNGSGGFATAGSTAGTLFADVNGDGRLDGLSVGAGVGVVYLGNGSGGFVSVTEFPAQGRARDLATGDVNGDGHLDVVTANAASNNVSVHLGNGSGSFPAPTLFSNFNHPWSVALGDVNADGNLDIVTGNNSQNYVSVMLGDGNGAFGPPTSLVDPGPVRAEVALGDMNNDGRLDIVVSKGRVLLGDGKGGFVTSASFSPGTDVAVGDVNGDGRLDVAAVAFGANKVTVLLGNGAGGFSGSFDRPTGPGPIEVALGDLNGDGRLDVATANSTANSVSVLLNDGGGGFPETRYYLSGATGQGPFHVALGDLNGDERLDIMTDHVLLFGRAP
ncbi:MAG TPA: VCBS repeat-containing protein, partial [Longimicrobium sp.]